ncbi:nuclear transport factor 2 family protein [Microvirga sp. CF3062]|uniref:nuclear transport factor 2 family protein n=1 Tax=Microvirga sp. CF3062 TaxID=3110182 RepID=UPI002E773D64|nr:nuclear transport factor 2 family protein [Microvirga sp. CF3062]MEE1658308.1 nuclear transport factor 2 family protein [Microvirga sp. CF3062]
MSKQLPLPLAGYYEAKNQHDINGMLAPFAEDAVVKDEDQEHHGREAIRSWMEHTTRKYRVTIDVKQIEPVDDRLIVSGLVSGDFPGSPAMLRYAFTLSGSKIARLEIA